MLRKQEKQKEILTGNEAIARGAFEAGLKVATAYPGTPSTEILENIAKYKEIYSQWSVNEKVALEVASGASIAGTRALAAMKHVGLNVAADPLMTLAYTGVNGGLVVISADDPGMHSSQNEQDNRYYSVMANIPLIEPSDSQECKDFLKESFEISEKFDIPVLFRTTTRISHSRSVVEIDEKYDDGMQKEIHKEILIKQYIKDPKKYVMIPANAQIRHKDLLKRWEKLKKYSSLCNLNKIIYPKIKSKEISKNQNNKNVTYNFKENEINNININYINNIIENESLTIKDINDIKDNEDVDNLIKKDEILKELTINIGIITSGICYQFAKEVFSELPILKLGMPYPLPENLIRDFIADKELIIIIEELEPFIEGQVQKLVQKLNLNIEIIGKQFFPRYGELNLNIVKDLYLLLKDFVLFEEKKLIDSKYFLKKVKSAKAKQNYKSDYLFAILQKIKNKKEFNKDKNIKNDYNSSNNYIDINNIKMQNLDDYLNTINSRKYETKINLNLQNLLNTIPPRPPVLCAGCSHRSVFYILKKLKLIVMGDIGCYTLAVLPPLNSIDTTLCMGAGIGQALGFEKARPEYKGKIVSVIGDSTFFHSGITALIDNVFNKGTGLIIILDNRTTAMTGHQTNPGIGKTLLGQDTTMILPENIAAGVGVKNIKVVDPYDIKLLEKTIKEELLKDELSVLVCRRQCVLLSKNKSKDEDKNIIQKKYFIDQDTCKSCGICLKYGCPAIEFREGKYLINESMCVNCGVCEQICPSKSIKVKV